MTLDYAEPKTEQNIQDKIAWQTWLSDSKQKTVPEIMVDNNPELSLEDAQKKYEENQAAATARQEAVIPTDPQNDPQNTDPNQLPNAQAKP